MTHNFKYYNKSLKRKKVKSNYGKKEEQQRNKETLNSETVNTEETDLNITLTTEENEHYEADISTSSRVNFHFSCTNQVSF